jgi:hypothetical protein
VSGTAAGVVDRWLAAYIEAWTSNDPDEIGNLFAIDARRTRRSATCG